MKVYKLRLVLGKSTNYDQTGKLKNQTITAKYAGEGELENILSDQTWKKLGACEISCVGVYDTETKAPDLELTKVINDRISKDIQTGIKPKTEIELLKEQITELTEKVNNPAVPKNQEVKETFVPDMDIDRPPTEKEIRESLFIEAKELGLTPAKNVKTLILKDLIAKAKK